MTDVMRGRLTTRGTYQRTALGIVAMLASLGALLAVLLPFRAHLSIAIPALAFVLPAVVGVVIGGFAAGALGALAGFLVYDFFFLPPYNTLTVRSPQHWTALFVYVVVVLIVAQVVAQLASAREDAQRRKTESERLHELSQALIGDLTLAQLLTHIVDTVQAVFGPRWTALVLPVGGRRDAPTAGELQVAATAGEHPTDEIVPGLLILRTEGRLTFASVPSVSEGIRKLVHAVDPKVVVFECSGIPDFEYTALRALIRLDQKLAQQGIELWLAALNPAALAAVNRSSLGPTLGRKRMFFNVQAAVAAYQAQGRTRAPGPGASARS